MESVIESVIMERKCSAHHTWFPSESPSRAPSEFPYSVTKPTGSRHTMCGRCGIALNKALNKARSKGADGKGLVDDKERQTIHRWVKDAGALPPGFKGNKLSLRAAGKLLSDNHFSELEKFMAQSGTPGAVCPPPKTVFEQLPERKRGTPRPAGGEYEDREIVNNAEERTRAREAAILKILEGQWPPDKFDIVNHAEGVQVGRDFSIFDKFTWVLVAVADAKSSNTISPPQYAKALELDALGTQYWMVNEKWKIRVTAQCPTEAASLRIWSAQ